MYGGKRAKDVNTLQFNKFTEKQNIEKKNKWTFQPCRLAKPL